MATPFQVEAWTEYAIGLLVLLVRIVYRSTIVGTNWEGDDYFALIAVFFWTGELVMLELIGQYGSITGMTDEIALTLSDKQIERIVVGSKCLLAGWILYVTLIWCLKACMLFLYRRLTLNLTQRRMVYITACTCAVLYIVTIIVILTRCQPFHANWQVYPYPGDACALNIPNYIALAITNVTTDMMILYIPLPLLWSVQMPMARKIICSLWLCTGVFIIIATLLRCILCLQDAQSINLGTIWSIRETFVGILAVNAPVLGPWIAKNASAVRSRTSKNRSKTGGQESANHIVTIGAKESTHRLDRLTKDGRRGLGWTEIDNDSEERIMKTQNDVAVSAKRSDEELNREVSPNGIHVKTTFQVSG
ncbi:hypothetical protein CGCSCA4_v014490 [Colletotrichum siamense]|uniref:Rhodopsin domain-containing protein n=1 Tax=Colletotrichum siamense TaxID=690259 RepID=A0A9P5EU64_COLSI|nr:uncharacterized protein CGCS363_v007976 [Colletotrichum siamense]KAF4829801.1 hypothetical protein CGCSCA4_v014490 [Colletotrichum siamense]KAF4859526.1 hypothetical protein CGCSCA2_v006086 [Colletotrichum siamense]KAF5498100.1 hypothetical protein CGCS363_v007976 [Colletotrichum siamense]KAJ3961627.1 hypothetical protein N0V92_001680 [Colletotrichum tropicale]